MARSRYSSHVAANVRREGVQDRHTYLQNAMANAVRGQDLPQSKLTEDDALDIRSAAKQRENMRKHIRENLSNEALARKHGVHVRTIEKVLQCYTWSHV